MMENHKKDEGFAERLIRLRLELPLRNLKPVKIKTAAKEAGVNLNSYGNAENGIIPGDAVLTKIARYFGVSEDYLLGKDQGDTQTRQAHEKVPPYIKEKVTAAPIIDSQDSLKNYQFKLSESLTKAAEVLESGTSYATALHLNIVHFHRAIQAESEIAELRAENKELKARIERLEEKMDKFIAERMAAQENSKIANASSTK